MELQSIKRDGYNDFSPELAKRFPGLKPGEVMIFKGLNVKPDPYNKGRIIAPHVVNVPPKSSVWDPGKNRYIPIAAIKGTMVIDRPVPGTTSSQPVEVTQYFEEELQLRHAAGGCKFCYGTNPDDVRVAEYLFFCGYNASLDKELRPSGAKPIFTYKDNKAQAAKELGLFEVRRQATDALAKIIESPDEIRTFAGALGWDADDSIPNLTIKLIKYAEKSPKKFLTTVGDPTAKTKSIVNRAFERGILSFDSINFDIKWADTGDKLLGYPKHLGAKAKAEQTARHILDSKSGSQLLGELVRRLDLGEKKPELDISGTAKKLIDEHNLDASDITGTGADGKILKSDVEAYMAASGIEVV